MELQDMKRQQPRWAIKLIFSYRKKKSLKMQEDYRTVTRYFMYWILSLPFSGDHGRDQCNFENPGPVSLYSGPCWCLHWCLDWWSDYKWGTWALSDVYQVRNGLCFISRFYTSVTEKKINSRAEYRLTLRADNADLRLTRKGADIGCVSAERLAKLEVWFIPIFHNYLYDILFK